MTSKDNAYLARERSRSGVTVICFRLLATLVFLSSLAVSTSYGQVSTYSDSWVVSNPGIEYDPATDEYFVPEGFVPYTEIAGAGITETDYNSDSESVTTTLTSPDGRSSTVTSYLDPWYSRAELALPANPNEDDPNEYEWTVNTSHSYWYEQYEEPCQDPYPYNGPARPCYQAKASYGAPRPLFYYYTVYSFYTIYIGAAGTAFTDPVFTKWFGNKVGCRYTRRMCTSNCNNPSTFVEGIPCKQYAQAIYMTWRTWLVRGCVLHGAWGLNTPGKCTPRTW